jgi:NAD(P)-dependent dehydrogenase (short-subunit alcohol dehydrogenase family)
MNAAPTDLFDVTGRVALVTGASRGIGEAAARTLAAYGAKVVVASRRLEACEAVAASIRSAGGDAQAVGCHIGEMAQVQAAFEAIGERYGRLDILVNNAATNPYHGPIVETDLAAFQKTVDVNIRGYFFMSALGAKLMAKGGGGSIVNVASINGVVPGHLNGIYSITKAAVISMTKAFAKECGPMGVRVNALLPGLTDTRFAAALVHSPDPAVKERIAKIPLGRCAQPDEMSGAILYFASPASGFATGGCLTVDGGFLVG